MEELEKISENLDKILEEGAPLLVGELLKNLEILDGEGLTFEQLKTLYKKLVREKVYQHFRYLKKLIKINLDIGTIQFRTRKE